MKILPHNRGGASTGREKMVEVFALGAAIALICAAVLNHRVYLALVGSFPLQFQHGLNSRCCFPEAALSASTPLPLQADYVKSLMLGCLGMLCASLAFLSAGRIDGGLLFLAGSVLIGFSTIRSWRTYRENCDRPGALPPG
jgi:hypothetical protein